MNILMVCAYPPVLHWHGGGVRMYHNIRILSERHSVHVLSFVGSDEERERLAPVKSICESVGAVRRVPDFRPHWMSLLPFLVREFSTPAMHQAVDEGIRKWKADLVQCEYLQMAQFRRRGVASILTAHEAVSKNAYEAFLRAASPSDKLRSYYRWMQLLRYETQQVRQFDRVVTMTEEDARYLRSYARGARIDAVPIGIDPEEFAPHPENNAELTALFVGNFQHSPNVEAAAFLIEKVAPRFPQVKFVIPGSPIPAGIHAGPNVSLPGYIADTRECYKRPNTIVLTPLFSGTGQRVKLLEAFAMACPVVTTRVGAMGFPIADGREAILADTAEEFCAALNRLAASREMRVRLGEAGRRMILGGFTWDIIAEKIWNVASEAASVSR